MFVSCHFDCTVLRQGDRKNECAKSKAIVHKILLPATEPEWQPLEPFLHLNRTSAFGGAHNKALIDVTAPLQ